MLAKKPLGGNERELVGHGDTDGIPFDYGDGE